MFLYDVGKNKQVTINFSNISDFTYNKNLDKQIALATKKILDYDLMVYIDENGYNVSDLYDSFLQQYVYINSSNFKLEDYIKREQCYIRFNKTENDDKKQNLIKCLYEK